MDGSCSEASTHSTSLVSGALPPPPPGGIDISAGDVGSGEGRGWRAARGILRAARVASHFHTLRDLMSSDAYIQPSRLVRRRQLGQGSSAKVHLALLTPEAAVVVSGDDDDDDIKTAKLAPGGAGREVAVKALRRELLRDPEQVQMFVSEVALLRKLRHRCAVPVSAAAGDPQAALGLPLCCMRWSAVPHCGLTGRCRTQ